MSSFSVGDESPTIGCTAIDDIDGPITCDWSGVIDTDIIGEYLVTYVAEDSSGNITSLDVTYVVLRDNSLLNMTLSEYYNSVEGLYGEALLLELRNILNTGVTMQTYGDSRYILNISDRDPLNSSNVILVYRGTSISGIWDEGATWNREHVWPQSLLGVTTNNSSRHVGADLHNLKPANPSENSSRGNKYFDDITTSDSYAPRNEIKGDLARILFYMIVMYDYLELINSTPAIYQMALLDLMIEWHENDLVDTFESNRNDIIYSYQNNRNPFIDYPHLLELIFYDHPYYAS